MSDDPFEIPDRETAIALWSVADAAKAFLGHESARVRGVGGRRAAGLALLKLSKELDALQAHVERHRRGG